MKEIEEKKQKLEELITLWKAAMSKSDYIVKHVDHWYDDDNEYAYVVMTYCGGGDFSQEIQKRIDEKRKFTQEVWLIIHVKEIYLIKRRCRDTPSR
jgi:serine/threonine protein kinase